MVFWNIWKERNQRVFEGKLQSRSEVLESIIREIGSWLLVVMEFKGMFLSDFIRDWSDYLSSLFAIVVFFKGNKENFIERKKPSATNTIVRLESETK